MIRLKELMCSDAETFDRERIRDVVNLLRAVGCVLSGAALLVREVRHFTEIRRSMQPRKPRRSQYRSFRKLVSRKSNVVQETLYRPVGPEELALIAASGYREFPPQLPDQPIFYPITDEDDATKIARNWSMTASGAGFVTRFSVRSDYLAAYCMETVGSSVHQEYWIPAAELPAFNAAIIGEIEVIAEFPAVNESTE